jgi:DNA-binding NtrC family response regulator
LESRNFNIFIADLGRKAIETAREYHIDIALVELKIPDMNGERLIESLKREHKWLEVIILTGASAFRCIRKGAYHYLEKPCRLEVLIPVLSDAYKNLVSNKNKMRADHLRELLAMAQRESPRALIRRIKEMRKELPGSNLLGFVA